MIKWAIFGAGNISNTFARNIKQVENAKIVAVASKDKEKIKGKIGTFEFKNNRVSQKLKMYKAENNSFKEY